MFNNYQKYYSKNQETMIKVYNLMNRIHICNLNLIKLVILIIGLKAKLLLLIKILLAKIEFIN